MKSLTKTIIEACMELVENLGDELLTPTNIYFQQYFDFDNQIQKEVFIGVTS